MEGYREFNEKKCPICDKIVRSDATIKESCPLCGMGIPEPDNAVKYEQPNGTQLYFCCEKCYAIYINDVIQIND